MLVVIVGFAVWVLVVHTISLPEQQGSPKISATDKSVSQVEKLIRETEDLVHSILSSNLTLSGALASELRRIAPSGHNGVVEPALSTTELDVLRREEAQCRRDLELVQTELHACNANHPSRAASSARIAHSPAQLAAPSLPPPPLAGVHPPDPAAFGYKRWLVVGIPTVARLHDEDYLLQTLHSFASQLPTDPADILYGQVLLHVINFQVNNNKHRRHVIFEKAKEIYSRADNPLSKYFLFSELQESELLSDPVPNSSPREMGTPNKPGFIVRRQTRNIATTVYKSLGMGHHYLFLEDDMEACPYALLAIQYLLKKASRYHPNWLAIRASYGMNGIFMHDQDLHAFLQYLLEHQKRRPPDHLVVEYYAGETAQAKKIKGQRANIGFKFNLFNHLGVVSTLRSQKMSGFPTCYEMLVEPTVFQVEAYSARDCPRDDLWPCKVAKPETVLIDWGRMKR